MAYPYLTDLFNAIFGTDLTLPVPTFGVMVAIALAVSTVVARKDVRRLESSGRLPASTHLMVGDMVFASAFAGLVGARIFHILDNTDQFLASPGAMIFSRGGFSIYGGLLVGIGTGAFLLRQRRLPIVPMLDAIAPSLMLGYAIGRIGCQLSGDGDWGIASDMALKPDWVPDWLWAQTYAGNILGATIPEPGVYPTPLYESAAALVLFGILRAIRSAEYRPGYQFSMYLILTGFARLLIEKIRINQRHEWLGISITQAEAVSIILIVGGLTGVVLSMKTRKIWPRALYAAGVLTALSACVPL